MTSNIQRYESTNRRIRFGGAGGRAQESMKALAHCLAISDSCRRAGRAGSSSVSSWRTVGSFLVLRLLRQRRAWLPRSHTCT